MNLLEAIERNLPVSDLISSSSIDQLSQGLHLTFRISQFAAAKVLLEKGADPFALDHKRRNCIHLCAKHNQIDILKKILENSNIRQHINASDAKNMTPLHVAIKKGHTAVVQTLLEAGATFRIEKILQLVVEMDDAELIKALMHAGVNPSRVTIEGKKCVVYAVLNGKLKAAREIIVGLAGGNYNNQDIDGVLLCVACEVGALHIVERLLEGGVNPKYNCEGESPLMIASRYGFLEIVQALLRDDPYPGANLETVYNVNEGTALNIAARHGKGNVVSFLMSVGARIHSFSTPVLKVILEAYLQGHNARAKMCLDVLKEDCSLEKMRMVIGWLLNQHKFDRFFPYHNLQLPIKSICEIGFGAIKWHTANLNVALSKIKSFSPTTSNLDVNFIFISIENHNPIQHCLEDSPLKKHLAEATRLYNTIIFAGNFVKVFEEHISKTKNILSTHSDLFTVRKIFREILMMKLHLTRLQNYYMAFLSVAQGYFIHYKKIADLQEIYRKLRCSCFELAPALHETVKEVFRKRKNEQL